MADGTFAALLVLAGLADMSFNHCGTDTGCLGVSEDTPRLSFAIGSWVDRNADEQLEAYLRYDFARHEGPFGFAAGASVAEEGEVWAGFGATYDLEIGDSGFFTELHFMPGLYADNGGFDLGGAVIFRSGIEFGYEAANGWRFGVGYDHRSNGGLYDQNPGVETVHLRMSVAF